jgi:hypothetical protein
MIQIQVMNWSKLLLFVKTITVSCPMFVNAGKCSHCNRYLNSNSVIFDNGAMEIDLQHIKGKKFSLSTTDSSFKWGNLILVVLNWWSTTALLRLGTGSH